MRSADDGGTCAADGEVLKPQRTEVRSAEAEYSRAVRRARILWAYAFLARFRVAGLARLGFAFCGDGAMASERRKAASSRRCVSAALY